MDDNKQTAAQEPPIAQGLIGRVSANQFYEAPGVEDWRVVFGGGWACGHFQTGSFSVGVALVQAVGELADAVDHHPDVDLRPEGVTVRLYTPDVDGLSALDIELAQRISEAAQKLGAAADPTAVQHVQVAIDALAPAEVRPFWRAVLGYQEVGDEDLHDPHRRGPTFYFQQMDAPRPQRNRFHIDVYLPRDQVQARLTAALAAGGHLVSAANAPGWWTLADAEGNEVDLAIWD